MLLVFGITNTKWVQCNHSFGCTGSDLFFVQKIQKKNFGVNWSFYLLCLYYREMKMMMKQILMEVKKIQDQN